MALIVQSVETGLRDALKTAVEALDLLPGETPVYRCWWGDDEADETFNDDTRPQVAVKCVPEVREGYKAKHCECEATVRVATDPSADPKRKLLASLYGAVRTVIEADAWATSGGGFTKLSAWATASECGVEGDGETVEQFATLTLRVLMLTT